MINVKDEEIERLGRELTANIKIFERQEKELNEKIFLFEYSNSADQSKIAELNILITSMQARNS